jgi:hypothetical protein
MVLSVEEEKHGKIMKSMVFNKKLMLNHIERIIFDRITFSNLKLKASNLYEIYNRNEIAPPPLVKGNNYQTQPILFGNDITPMQDNFIAIRNLLFTTLREFSVMIGSKYLYRYGEFDLLYEKREQGYTLQIKFTTYK